MNYFIKPPRGKEQLEKTINYLFFILMVVLVVTFFIFNFLFKDLLNPGLYKEIQFFLFSLAGFIVGVWSARKMYLPIPSIMLTGTCAIAMLITSFSWIL